MSILEKIGSVRYRCIGGSSSPNDFPVLLVNPEYIALVESSIIDFQNHDFLPYSVPCCIRIFHDQTGL